MNNIQAFAPPHIHHQARRRGSNALRKGRNNADPTAGRDSSILHWIVGERQRNAIEQRRAGRTGCIKFCMMESEWQRIPAARKAGQPTAERQVRGAGIPPTGNTLFTLYSTFVLSLSRAFAKQFLAKDCVSVCHFDAPSNDHFGGAHADVMQVCDYNPWSFIMQHGAVLPPNFQKLKT